MNATSGAANRQPPLDVGLPEGVGRGDAMAEARQRGSVQHEPIAGKHPLNVCETARAVEAVRSIADSMVVEGGFIGSGSEIQDSAPDAAPINNRCISR